MGMLRLKEAENKNEPSLLLSHSSHFSPFLQAEIQCGVELKMKKNENKGKGNFDSPKEMSLVNV